MFFVSAASVGFEVELTRYFAIASWSEYGYWVISIVMVGFSASGVLLSLFKDFFLRRGPWFLFWIPITLMVVGALGFYLVTLIPFNPLEFQNKDLWFNQLLNVWKYYAVLFPYFFLTGLYVGLSFLANADRIPAVYAADLIGAGSGSLFLMGLLYIVHPFYLYSALLPLLLLASLWTLSGQVGKPKTPVIGLILGLFVLSEAGSIFLNQADFCQYKAIYPPLHVQGNQVKQQVLSPRGQYLVLDNFTERVDIDLSNNYSLLGVDGPPLCYGLYQDGNRITELPKNPPGNGDYIKAALELLPYQLRPQSKALLIGTRGGFKVREVLQKTTKLDCLEPDPIIDSLVSHAPYAGDWWQDPKIHLYQETPAGFLKQNSGPYDIIDLSAEFLGQGEANKFAFAQEVLKQYFQALSPNGILSIPSSIQEFTVYALKEVVSVKEALQSLGVQDPENHLVLYRSAWNTRLLVFKNPVAESDLKIIRKFCSDRSFDTSYFPGIEPAKLEIWNDLPPITFDVDAPYDRSDKASDSLMDDTLKLLSKDGDAFQKNYFFNLTPSTLDRPFFYSVLKLSNIGQVLNSISLVPRQEIGYLINLAVLVQSILLASVVLLLPLVFRKQTHFHGIGQVALYFSSLGLGFLFIEIFMIEKASYFLGDRATAFTLVLCGMLFFSGLGSWAAGRLKDPQKGLAWALAGAGLWLIFSLIGLTGLLSAYLSSPMTLKCLVLLGVLAPVSFALGLPFSLGLSRLKSEGGMVPWAWALNGAFSVVATPLANLLANSTGYSLLLGLSLGLYLVVFLVFSKLGHSTGAT